MDTPSFKLLVLRTSSPDKLREFYECLGLSFDQEQHGKGPIHFAAAMGDAIVEIYPLNSDVAIPNTEMRLGFAVSDLDLVIAALRARSTSFRSEARSTPWGTRAIVHDPDGRTIELYQKA